MTQNFNHNTYNLAADGIKDSEILFYFNLTWFYEKELLKMLLTLSLDNECEFHLACNDFVSSGQVISASARHRNQF